MSTPEQRKAKADLYRARAKEAFAHSRRTSDTQAKLEFSRIAQSWIELAEEIERSS